MPSIEIGGQLHPVEDCPTCGATVAAGPRQSVGFVSRCGRRKINLSEMRDIVCPTRPVPPPGDPA